MYKVSRTVAVLLLCVLLMSALPTFAQENITVLVDGTAVHFTDQQPVLIADRVLVPMRDIFNALGAVVEYIEETDSVFASKRSNRIWLEIGASTLYVNDTAVTLDVPSQLIHDRTMVPLRAVSEAFNAEVYWDDDTQTVQILTRQGNHTIEDCYIDKQYTAPDGTVLLNVRYAYPQIQNDEQSEGIQQLNDKFIQAAYRAVEETTQSLLPFAQDEYNGKADTSSEFHPHFYERSFDIGIDTEDILSVVEYIYIYTNGAHPNMECYAAAYDLHTGRELALTDFFRGTEAEIQAMVVQTFHKIIDEEPDAYFEDAKATLNELVKDVIWYPAADGFVFLFHPYMIAPYASGFPRITLVYSSGHDVFSPAFLEQVN